MLAVLLTGCATSAPTTDALQVGELVAGSRILKGYLAPADLPDSLRLLPPPPSAGSALEVADRTRHEEVVRVREAANWARAAADGDLYPDGAVVASFGCVLGVEISAEKLPHLDMLLRRSLSDAGLATYAAKIRYSRPRPYAQLGEASCRPDDEPALRNDGAYPSGHASIGWAWALILTELAPDRTGPLLQRGLEIGDSRQYCGVHWHSDIEAGRLVGAATVARLHGDAVFRTQLEWARREVEAARQHAHRASPACAARAAP